MMYSDVKNVRLLIALMKEHGIKTAVLSSGTCSIPVIHSMEIDPFFECYSDIDERSAVYFAIGLAQMKREVVAVVCTSGTATCNYLPGICEARRQNIPLLVITCDKDQNTLGHLTIQKINQHDMYARNCKKSVCIPVIKDENDDWAARTMISQAIFELDHNGSGPVQINIYTDGDKKTFNTPDLPIVKKIERIDFFKLLLQKKAIDKYLRSKTKILVVTGENSSLSDNCVANIEKFCVKYGAVWSAEHVANSHSEVALNTYKIFEQITFQEFCNKLKPEIVISMGENFASYGIKSILKKCSFSHWWIDPKGRLVDVWNSLSCVIDCEVDEFFKIMTEEVDNRQESAYQRAWKIKLESIKIPTEEFTSLYIVKRILDNLNGYSTLDMGILNSTRLVHLFDIPKNTNAYSNLGALGIDGSLSTFLGHISIQNKEKALCIIGDLSFFYDINSINKFDIPSNANILLLNNGGGSEFHLNTGIDVIPMLDDFISAGHHNKVTEWAKVNGLKYIAVKNDDELDLAIQMLNSDEGPVLVEAITDIENDSLAIKKMYKVNGYDDVVSNKSLILRKILTSLLGIKKTQKIVRMAKIWREK